MKKLLLLAFFFIAGSALAQNEQLAQNYFDKGDYEKAAISYEELLKSQPANGLYFQKVVDSYQQLAQFDKVEKLLLPRFEKFKQPNLLVEIAGASGGTPGSPAPPGGALLAMKCTAIGGVSARRGIW